MVPDSENTKSVTQSTPPSFEIRNLRPLQSNLQLPRPKILQQKMQNEVGDKQWNTRNLGLRLASDAAAAASAGIIVAPLITVIDRGIFENASGRNEMMSSIRSSLRFLLTRPHLFLVSRPFRLIFTLYGSTYLTANALDTVTATVKNNPSATVTTGPSKFLATSAANMSICIYKDSQFTKMFGPLNSAPRPVPKASFALFALRDSLTIFASFNVPPLLAPHLPISEAWEKSVMTKASVAQFVAPAAIQIVSTPLHLLGLDLYNRPGRVDWMERARKVRIDWLKSTLARMCRIIPAFGVGGVVNTKVRMTLLGGLEGA